MTSAVSSPPHDVCLRVSGVSKAYGPKQVLADLDLEVGRGEIVGLLGPNGAGKTTLVSIIAGLREPDSGSVDLAGIDAVRRPGEARRLLGIAPQELGIYPVLKVRDNLMFFGALNGLPRRKVRARIDEVAEALGLQPLLDSRAHDLSGGQKRRLHTAAALLHEPELLILDEPTVGADVDTRAQLLRAVQDLAERGSAVIYTTHYLPEIETLGASVAVLQGGKIIMRGLLADLVTEYGTSVVELTFEGPAPALPTEFGGITDGSVVRISTDTPAAVTARALDALPAEDETRLRAVEILQPSLDTVYLALTGQRYVGDVGDAAEAGTTAVAAP
jgi:ABC-2 type transport system ATP-binding protein